MFSKIKEKNRTELETIVRELVGDKLDPLLSYLDNSDFYYAPAAKKYHDNYPGGLYEHSRGLFNELYRLRKEMSKNWTDLELLIISFGHDLCKIKLYEPKMNELNEVTYDIYPDRVNKDEGHGTKSLQILAEIIPELLTERIAKSVICHMGLWTKDIDNAANYILEAQTQDDLVFFTHVADMVSSRKSRGIECVIYNPDDGTIDKR